MTETGSLAGRRPRAAVFGCAGTVLSADERKLFTDADPLGLILFQRNCEEPEQVRALVDEFRSAVGRADAPVLIDQEGGRVQRLKPPHWRDAPAAGALVTAVTDAGGDFAAIAEAVTINSRLIAAELIELGITVDCAPVLDLPVPGADAIIGDRAFGVGPEEAARLGSAACEGFMASGVAPVIKHIPGHGRATVDSHESLPVVDTSVDELAATDFVPFRGLAGAPWAMTAHVVYSELDPDRPATLSSKLIGGLIREGFGFDGVLVSDDLGMSALEGDMGERAARAIEAGCDVALHCSGEFDEMTAVAETAPPMNETAHGRFVRAEVQRRQGPHLAGDFDRVAALRRLSDLTGGML